MSVTEMSQRESRCDFGVSHTTPTRPDPTRPLYRWLASTTSSPSYARETATRWWT